jgi:hypothetical protein
VSGKFFPCNEEPPVPVLTNKLELFFSSILFPHLNGIKKPVLGPVQKKQIPITTGSRSSSKPNTIGRSFTALKDVHIIMYIHECGFGMYHLLVLKSKEIDCVEEQIC